MSRPLRIVSHASRRVQKKQSRSAQFATVIEEVKAQLGLSDVEI